MTQAIESIAGATDNIIDNTIDNTIDDTVDAMDKHALHLPADSWIGAVRDVNAWSLVAVSDTGTMQCLSIAAGGEANLSEIAAKRQVIGYSATTAVFRRIHLPFTRRRQIQMLLPQEIADQSLFKREQPAFAYHIVINNDSADVCCAVSEQSKVDQTAAEAATCGLRPGAMVMAELAAWPLLATRALLVKDQRPTLVIDQSAMPFAVFKIAGEDLLAVRTVCATADAAVASEELRWLAQTLAEPDVAVLLLGDVDAAVSQAFPQARQIDREQFAIDHWRWLRPLGLATAARERHWAERLLDFGGADSTSLRRWLQPWLPALVIAASLLCVGMGQFLWDMARLGNEEQALRAQLSATFQTALPNTPMIDPLRQLQAALPSRGGGNAAGLVAWLGTLQPLLTEQAGIRMDLLRYDGSGVIVSGEADNYAKLNAFQLALQQQPAVNNLTVEDATKAINTNGIQFRLRLR